MTVLLVGPDFEENLSIRYLSSSLLAAGHHTILAPFNAPIDASAVANAAQSADIIGLSMCFQARASEFLGLARRLKSECPGKLIVAGGHYASCAAEPLLTHHPEIDLIVIHEGEHTLVEIADGVPPAQIPGIAYRDGNRVRTTAPRPTLADLDGLPCPDRRGPIHWIAGVPTSYLMGSRGCYGNCAYCCITTLHRLAPGKRFRQRAVDRIADEMSSLYHDRGTRQFIFHDDNFLVPSEAINHARILALENALKLRGVHDIALVIKCRPADASYDVLRRLKSLGLIRVFLGIESATPRGLSVLERNQTVDESVRALETCAALDISAQYTLMIFHPDTTLDTLRADVAFLRRFPTNPLNFCRTEIYAGTPLEQRMIDCGRARGDYRGRDYHFSDPAAGLAFEAARQVLHDRCWTNYALMQNAIGLDHAGAVVKHFYKGGQRDELSGRVAAWLRTVNADTIDLLEACVEQSEPVRELAAREAHTRARLLSEAMQLRIDLQSLQLPARTPVRWPPFARPAAAALLAIGSLDPHLVAQQTPASTLQEQGTSSITGRVIDPSGAAVPRVSITVTNTGTGASRTVTTDGDGRFLADGLTPGNYTLRAQSPGFKMAVRTNITLKPGVGERIDIGFTLEVGCCEMVAVGTAIPQPANLIDKRKPFTYIVGQEQDNGTLQGIAKLVYGDSNAWILIFRANRDIVKNPAAVPFGSALLIPPKTRRGIPKLIHGVQPIYPPEARREHISGSIILDLTLKADGAVMAAQKVSGDDRLAEAARTAVLQWRFRPLRIHTSLVLNFPIAITFEKNGKVRTIK
jgi:TonB family protein